MWWKKAPCLAYLHEHPDVKFFQQDVPGDTNGRKQFLACSYEAIWCLLCQEPYKASLYEAWLPDQPMKLFIDYERSGTQHDRAVATADIINITSKIFEVARTARVSVMQSFPDDHKLSYHLVFDDVYFVNASAQKAWLEEHLSEDFTDLFDKKIIDMTVYKAGKGGCFRTLGSTKSGQDRPLKMLSTAPLFAYSKTVIQPFEQLTFDVFNKTCITSVNAGTCHLIEAHIPTPPEEPEELVDGGSLSRDEDVIKEYLAILDPSRYQDRSKWLNVGYILRSLDPGFRPLFHTFSARWEHYNAHDVDIAWASCIGDKKYGIESLRALAMHDNPDWFANLQTDLEDRDLKSLTNIDMVLCRYVHRVYSSEFVNTVNNVWHHFNGVRWVPERRNIQLKLKVGITLYDRIQEYARKLTDKKHIKRYNSVLQKIGGSDGLRNLDLVFTDYRFEDLADQDPFLIGFENGIYDLQTDEFRQGTPGDYVTMSTHTKYTHYAPSDPLYIEIMDLLRKIFPREDVMEFTLRSLSTGLVGLNREENFYFWTGKGATGGNGKSTILSLLTGALGDYCIQMPVSLLTSERENSASANPALAQLRNRRAVIMQEPGPEQKIRVETLKYLSGNDKMSVRDLFKSQVEFQPVATWFLACNGVPTMNGMDGGVARRMKVTQFESVFCSDPDTDASFSDYKYKADESLKEKLPRYYVGFMCILLDAYR